MADWFRSEHHRKESVYPHRHDEEHTGVEVQQGVETEKFTTHDPE